MRSLCAEKNFWRYIALNIVTFGTRFGYSMIFFTLPKYMVRTIGSDSLYGTVSLATPLTAIIASLMFTSLVYLYSNYTLVVIGAIIVCIFSFVPAIGAHYAVLVVYCIGQGLGYSIF